MENSEYFFFVRAVRMFKVVARCSKYDFWNPGEILNGTRSGNFLVVKKNNRKNISIEKKKKFSSKKNCPCL